MQSFAAPALSNWHIRRRGCPLTCHAFGLSSPFPAALESCSLKSPDPSHFSPVLLESLGKGRPGLRILHYHFVFRGFHPAGRRALPYFAAVGRGGFQENWFWIPRYQERSTEGGLLLCKWPSLGWAAEPATIDTFLDKLKVSSSQLTRNC